jgi:uncharacterized membrane protein
MLGTYRSGTLELWKFNAIGLARLLIAWRAHCDVKVCNTFQRGESDFIVVGSFPVINLRIV